MGHLTRGAALHPTPEPDHTVNASYIHLLSELAPERQTVGFGLLSEPTQQTTSSPVGIEKWFRKTDSALLMCMSDSHRCLPQWLGEEL